MNAKFDFKRPNSVYKQGWCMFSCCLVPKCPFLPIMPWIFEAPSNHCTSDTTTCVSHHMHSVSTFIPLTFIWASNSLPWFQGSDFIMRTFVLIPRFLSNIVFADSLYHKRLSVDGRQLNLEVFDPCSQVCVYSFITTTLSSWLAFIQTLP